MKSQPDPADFLGPTKYMDSEAPAVQSRVASLELGSLSMEDRARRVFDFVRDEIKYEFVARVDAQDYVASRTLEEGVGFCVRKAILLCALGRAAGIPTALVFANLRDRTLPPRVVSALGTDTMFHHGLSAFHLHGQWIKVDASLSPALVKRSGYRPVEFDGKNEALQKTTTLSGKAHAEYVAFHGYLADLPFEDLMAAFARAYEKADKKQLESMGLNSF